MKTNRSIFVMIPLLSLNGILTPVNAQKNAPPPFEFGSSRVLYAEIPTGDRDRDGLHDYHEFMLADYFKPKLIFDSDEGHRRPDEPVTLFQVRPEGTVGIKGTRVWIKYVFLFQRDGGYGESSDCYDDHNGDNQSADFVVESDDGRKWQLIQINNSHFSWPDEVPVFSGGLVPEWQWTWDNVRFEGSHAVIYMSAHKHHQYFDTYNDEDDSPYSDWGCNDDVNGQGAHILPNLISPYPDKRSNNVGEPELHKYFMRDDIPEFFAKATRINLLTEDVANEHPNAKYFINSLDVFGYPGERAWGTKYFTGGLKDEGTTSDLASMWMHHGFQLSPDLQKARQLARLRGTVLDGQGKPIVGKTLYFRAAIYGGQYGPWSNLAVDTQGNYYIGMEKASHCLLRPAASDYDFKDVPKSVFLKAGEVRIVDFVGTPTPAKPQSGAPSTGRVVRRDPSHLRIPANSQLRLLQATALTPEQRDLLAPHVRWILRVNLPQQMVTPDSKAPDQGKGIIDPLTQLPRQFNVRFHLKSVISWLDGKPLQKFDASHMTKLIDTGVHGIKGAFWPRTGPPVAGARIRARLLDAKGLVEPQNTNWIEMTTNAEGNAWLTLKTGAHPGWTQLEVQITSNPVNPWALFSYQTPLIEIQPAIHGDDTITEPKVSLTPPQFLTRADPSAFAILANASFLVNGDFNFDHVVNATDLEMLRQSLGKTRRKEGYIFAMDLNGDGVIDNKDEDLLRRKPFFAGKRTRLVK